MDKNKQYMVVISFDGLSALDMEKVKEMDGFKEYFETASFCHQVKSVYPSLTYPAHTSISTGRYPNRHKIVNNEFLQPRRERPDWFWYRKYVQGDTFYELAEQNGIPTAALLWPVSAGAAIRYNMPEVLANRPWENQLTASLKAGTKSFQIDLFSRFGKYLNGISQPELDNFTHESFLYTLQNKDAQLFMVHYTDLDSIRHYNGFDSKEAHAALNRHAKRLEDIVQLLKEEGVYENTTLIVLGDHSSKDVKASIHLNSLFYQMGYIQIGKRGIEDYDAICNTCEGSAYVYVKQPAAVQYIYEGLKKLKEQRYIEEIYTSQEAEAMGADPECTFMVEASEGYYFSNDWDKDLIAGLYTEKNGLIKVNGHGYHPDKANYRTVFFASGRGIRPKVEIESMSLVDIGPTLANLLGYEMEKVDGRVLKEIINE